MLKFIFFRRRPTLFLKIVVLLSLAWISLILLIGYHSGGGGGGGSHIALDSEDSNNNVGRNPNPPEKLVQPVEQQIPENNAIHAEDAGNNDVEADDAAIEKEINRNINNLDADGARRVIEKPPEKQTTYDPSAPGEMGRPFRTPKNLTAAEKKLVSDGWQNNAFNQYASDRISVRRRLPDPRDPWCKVEGRYAEDLPATSVVICFHNEAWSVLLRTVHSVLDRSKEHLLTEIILVDDFSDMPHLFEPLETYMKDYPKVKIVRAKKREGLIRARLLGAANALGPVLTFLDSHIEATTGWLEPLLDRIHRDPTAVVCPVIDVIDDDTMEYHFSNAAGTSVGGFDWNLQFTWHAIPERERKLHENPAEPVASPTMAGGLFSIDKAFFDKLGTYDSGFDIWGGENLELSFKTWMCGGKLEIVPCSHVGHIFRKRSPYKWRSGVNVLRRNSVRLAKVWMDDYAQYYYDRIGNDLGDFGDISDRIKLRENLGCKSFKWFLTEIYSELFIPGEALAHGEIRNLGLGGNICLDSAATKKQTNKAVGLYPCHGQGGNQFWSYSKQGEIRRDEMCVDFAGSEPMIYPCHGSLGNQHWIYDDEKGLVRHGPSKKCMGIASKDKLVMEPCDETKDTQRWKFANYNPSI